jgi:hypothetical protein
MSNYSTAQRRTIFGQTLVRIGQDFLSPDADVQLAAEIEFLEFVDMVLTSLAPADEPPEEPERRERPAAKRRKKTRRGDRSGVLQVEQHVGQLVAGGGQVAPGPVG